MKKNISILMLVFSFMFSLLFFNDEKTYAMEEFLTINQFEMVQHMPADTFLKSNTFPYTFVNGKMMVPVRVLLNATEGSIIRADYDSATQTVTCVYIRKYPNNNVTYRDQVVTCVFQVNNPLGTKITNTTLGTFEIINGKVEPDHKIVNQTIQLSTPPIIYENRMLVPLRDCATAFNLDTLYKDEIYQGYKYMTVTLSLAQVSEVNMYTTDFSWRYKDFGKSPGFLLTYNAQEARNIADKSIIPGSNYTYYQLMEGSWFMYTDTDGEIGVGNVAGRCDTKEPAGEQGYERILYFNKDCTKLKHVIINEREVSLEEGYKIINDVL